MKGLLMVKEISQQMYTTLVDRGYSPEYTDGECIEFDCIIGGVKFSFYPIEDDVFGYSVEFNLERELTSAEKARLERIYLVSNVEEDVFDNFSVNDTTVCLSSAFTCDRYCEDLIDLPIMALTHPDGAVVELKAMTANAENE